ncbi:MAG: hypothetical protein QG608_600 [Actinomycetota bacterium]|nr:hypothetical protein [Actinomycetota bacterium]
MRFPLEQQFHGTSAARAGGRTGPEAGSATAGHPARELFGTARWAVRNDRARTASGALRAVRVE